MLDISTKPTELCSPFCPPLGDPNILSLTPVSTELAYPGVLFILQLTHTTGSLCHLKIEKTQPNNLTLLIMVVERWDWARLMVEGKVKTIVLAFWRYLKHLRAGMHILGTIAFDII